MHRHKAHLSSVEAIGQRILLLIIFLGGGGRACLHIFGQIYMRIFHRFSRSIDYYWKRQLNVENLNDFSPFCDPVGLFSMIYLKTRVCR